MASKRLSQQLPDRYADERVVIEKQEEENIKTTENSIASLAMCVGGCGIAVMAIATQLKQADIYYFAQFAFTLFGYQQIVAEAVAASFAAGCVSFFIALAAGFAALLNLRRTMQLCLLGVLAGTSSFLFFEKLLVFRSV